MIIGRTLSLGLCLIFCPALQAAEKNPFLPEAALGAGAGIQAASEPLVLSAAQLLRQRISSGEVELIGRVNNSDVYFDKIAKQYLYVPDESETNTNAEVAEGVHS